MASEKGRPLVDFDLCQAFRFGLELGAFAGSAFAIAALDGDIDAFTGDLWNSLHPDNRVSLFVRYIDLPSGRAQSRILNQNQ